MPGYNFPRLPLSAFLPGRRRAEKDEFLSRPRFLAISEFGPRALIYHEGSQYIINKVMLPVDKEVITSSAKLCKECGYWHPIIEGQGIDVCERCGSDLAPVSKMDNLLELQNVVAKRRSKISSDEEERLRLGYELKTAYCFDDKQYCQTAIINVDGEYFAELIYGPATLWRVNFGWNRRADKNRLGFNIDMDRGYWAKNEDEDDTNIVESDDPYGNNIQRVVPVVKDHRNTIIFNPAKDLSLEEMATLQSAFKRAVQVEYQLENQELSIEALPDSDNRKMILIYESAEGGAGVLKQLTENPDALRKVAKKALELCHFDPITGEDNLKAPGAKENCETACYDCLLNYGNQRDHYLIDRKLIKDYLLKLTKAVIEVSPVAESRKDHLARLMRVSISSLEKEWLEYMEKNNYTLPTDGQKLVAACSTRPDFTYEHHKAVVYIDGPHHEYADRHQRDIQQTEAMEDRGYTVIRFTLKDDWDAIIKKYPHVFGRK